MISLGIFGIDAVVFAIVALLTGAGLVWLAMWLAWPYFSPLLQPAERRGI